MSEPFLHDLPIAGDGSSRGPSKADGTTVGDGKSDEVGFAREKPGFDGPRRPDAEDVANAPRRTRTFNPLIKSQLLCQLS